MAMRNELAQWDQFCNPHTTFRQPLPSLRVTTQDFINFWGKIFVFILLVLIENS
jgi:hypothetical protein